MGLEGNPSDGYDKGAKRCMWGSTRAPPAIAARPPRASAGKASIRTEKAELLPQGLNAETILLLLPMHADTMVAIKTYEQNAQTQRCHESRNFRVTEPKFALDSLLLLVLTFLLLNLQHNSRDM